MRRGGVHLALDEPDVRRLEAELSVGRSAAEVLRAAFERLLDDEPQWIAYSDDAWRTIHNVLVHGDPRSDGGDYPLSHAVLGGRAWDEGTTLLRLKSPRTAADVAEALHDLFRADFLERCDALEAAGRGSPLPEADRMYAWRWLRKIAELYKRAAREGRWVLFGVEKAG